MFRRRSAIHRPRATDERPSNVVIVTDANFDDVTVGGHTLVDFWAPWCGPCLFFAPVFHEVARNSGGGVRFGTCNVDENPATATLLQIMSIPTLVVFGPDGSEVGRNIGATTQAALERLVGHLAAADSPQP